MFLANHKYIFCGSLSTDQYNLTTILLFNINKILYVLKFNNFYKLYRLIILEIHIILF